MTRQELMVVREVLRTMASCTGALVRAIGMHAVDSANAVVFSAAPSNNGAYASIAGSLLEETELVLEELLDT